LLALLSAGAVAGVLKALVGRSRPPLALHLVTESDASFPSGHSTDSAALFVAAGIVIAAVVFRRPLARVLCVAVGFAAAGLVGLSRLVLGVHYPTDVLAGWALGTVVAIALSTAVLVAIRAVPSSLDEGDGRLHRGRARAVAILRWQRSAHRSAVA
jgi:undecaprenyl-diphosphatase